MLFRVSHKTIYEYADLVTIGHNEARLRPRPTALQQVRMTELKVTPRPICTDKIQDYFGNTVDFFSIEKPFETLVVAATSEVETSNPIHIAPAATSPWEEIREVLDNHQVSAGFDALEGRYDSHYAGAHEALRNYARASFLDGRPILESVMNLMGRIYRDFEYKPGVTDISTPLLEVLNRRQGVCQDFAHLQIACLRSMGLSARYVSGYIHTIAPPGKAKVRGADASHAWLSVYCGDLGFIDLDPTNNVIPGERYITLGWGRDFGDVSPLKGVVMGGGSGCGVEVEVDVDAISQN